MKQAMEIGGSHLPAGISDLMADGRVVVLVMTPEAAREFFAPPLAGEPAFQKDLSLKEYRARFDPDLSPGWIRELCASGAFPDTVLEDGRTVPGAYKASTGNWRISLDGVRARQEEDRSAALRRRPRGRSIAPHLREDQEADEADPLGTLHGDERNNRRARPQADSHSSLATPVERRRTTVPRANQGRWKEARGVR